MMFKGLIKYIFIVGFIFLIWNVVLGYFSFLLFLLFILLFIVSLFISYRSMKNSDVLMLVDYSIIKRGEHFYLSFKRNDQSLIHCGKIIVDYDIRNIKNEVVYQHRQTIFDEIAMDMISLQHCGYYEICIHQIYCYDILQCLFIKKSSSQIEKIYVFPHFVPIDMKLQETIGYHQESQDYSPYQKGDDYSEVFDLRPYHENDSLRHIHWKASSKKGELFVKEGSQPIIKKIIIAYEIIDNDHINDQTYDTLYSLCSLFLDKNIYFELLCPQTDSFSLETIYNIDQMQTCLKRIFLSPNLSYQDMLSQSSHVQSFYVIKGKKIEVIQA